ncbi:MAG: methionyl-tRNA formyltransferase [Candidatus Magasanikbacteria bacterium]|nr:methionyl-tRNA formyltransferase [Candidatus Magasanikbacteria bacterium]|tara:strand:- start:431 stop:1120 length:690 start_codon:yes stop_codon:yes gene_type:complete
MATYVIATIKSWNIGNAKHFIEGHPEHDWVLVTEKEELTKENLEKINPKYVFLPHWSWIIPSSVFGMFTCIVFHMTDLPYGRGGSPLQNLIVRGKMKTKISAIQVADGIDTGDVFMKEELSLAGSATEIFNRFSDVVFTKMIPRFLEEDLQPVAQTGEVVAFARRKAKDGNIAGLVGVTKVYDYIRMLDAEGYPPAFIENESVKIEFKNAKLQESGKVTATVIIKQKKV